MISEKYSDGLVFSLSVDEVIDLYVFFNLYFFNFRDLMDSLSGLHKDSFLTCGETVSLFYSFLANRISDVE